MKMNATLCAGLAIPLLLCAPLASRAETVTMAAEYDIADGHHDLSAVRDLMESMMDLYAPGLKAKLLSIEKRFKDLTEFSGSIYLEGEETLSAPKISGEATVSNNGNEEQPLVNWSLKTSLDFDSGAVGMELWKDTEFARFTFTNEVEQDFSEEFEYRSLFKIEKKF